MKHLWRIRQFVSLDGEGGRLASARWHTAGKPVVYLTESPSASLLEFLAVFEAKPQDIPFTYPLLHIEGPEDAPRRRRASTAAHLESEIQLTRFLGDAWLEAKEDLFLIVPSVLCHATWNWILKPITPPLRTSGSSRRCGLPSTYACCGLTEMRKGNGQETE